MVFVRATEDSEQGMKASHELSQMFVEMGKCNEELGNAGILLAGMGSNPRPLESGWHPTDQAVP